MTGTVHTTQPTKTLITSAVPSLKVGLRPSHWETGRTGHLDTASQEKSFFKIAFFHSVERETV